MNLLNLIEDSNTGYDNLRALMQAVQNSQDALLTIGGEPVTLTYPEARFIYGKYKAYLKAGRQEEFISDLGDPVRFDLHMRQLRQLLDRQKSFRGSVPGERGVTGDVPQGQLEEISLQDPNNPTQQTAGKINWERMLKDYMENKPYSEFEFSGDRPLTIYRSQIYAILKDFGRMKPPQKVNIILNTFGDKYAMVDYIDKLRSKGMMPKKVPAYIAPDAKPVPTGQLDLPGMGTPKIKEAEGQKKKSDAGLDGTTARSPKVQRAFQLARARQAAAGSDIEAFVKDELEKAEQAQSEIEQLKAENDRQDQQIQQLAAKARQQDQAASTATAPKAEPAKAEPPKEKPKAAEKPAEPKKKEEPKAAEKPAEPKQQRDQPRAEPAQPDKPSTVDQPVPGDTQIQIPRPEPVGVPDNVVQFPGTATRRRKGPKKKTGTTGQSADPMVAATAGVDIPHFATGTYGLQEDQEELHVGDPVIIKGNVEYGGKTGDIVGFGRDKNFVIVDLYNFGQHAFHASNVEYNEYADQEDYLDENQRMDKFNIAQPPAGGTDKQREQFLDARDRLFRQMANASPGEKEAIRLKIADLEGQAQSKGIRIREAGEFNHGGYNAIRDVSDWAEKMRVMRELQKDIALMSDPESKEAVQQRIGDLIKVGLERGFMTEALSDKAMAVLQQLKKPAQAQTPAAVSPEKQAEIDSWAQDFQKNTASKLGKQVVAPNPQIDLNVPAEPARRRGRPSNAERAQRHEEFLSLRRRIQQLDELIKMKEQIDKLFLKAQNVRGGIYPGLQADIEAEELYPVPQTDREFEDLQAKYAKDLDALQKFLAMKKAVYREDEGDMLGESTALVRLKQARQTLGQQGVAEDAEPMDREFALVKKLGRLGERIVQNPKLWAKYEEANDSNNTDWIVSLIMEGTGATFKEVLRLSDLFGEIGGGLGRIIDFAWAVKEGHWEEDFLNPYREYRNKWDMAESQTDYQRRRQRERDVDAGKPVSRQPKNPQTDYAKKRAKDRRDMELGEQGVAEDSLKELAPAGGKGGGYRGGRFGTGGGDDDVGGNDPYQYPEPRRYNRSIDFFGRFEADHFDDEVFDDATGEFRGYWDDAEGRDQIAYFKFDNPTRTGDDDPGMGWYYEPQLDEAQDACYNKVKSRYKVWPSAYASGALVQCRKKGAANWGTGGKKKK